MSIALAAGVDPASAVEGFDPHEGRAGPVADVLRVLLQIVSGAGRDRVAGVPEELVRLLVHTHHRQHINCQEMASSHTQHSA